MSKLTAKQAAFVAEYLKDLNGTQAAIGAGYSPKTAAVIAVENLIKPNVKAAIDEAMGERIQRTKIDADWVLTRLAAEAEADLANLYDENGRLLPVKEWPLIWRQGLVAGVDTLEEKSDGVTIGTTMKLKLSDRVRRLELIGRHIGVNAFQEVIEHKGLNSLADRLERAHKRDAGDA
jgi:phage terminase small subunit